MELNGHLAGFEEISHTADWALKVWAPDLSTLFHRAVLGMYFLMGVGFCGPIVEGSALTLEDGDDESLLVNFLSELLYWAVEERRGYSILRVSVQSHHLTASGDLSRIHVLEKEIKAVTFHNLAIVRRKEQLEVTLVFDV